MVTPAFGDELPAPTGVPGGAATQLQRELPAPQSLADAGQPSQAPRMLASASDEGGSPTALTQAAPNILLPFLGPVSPYLLSGQLFTCTGLSGGETMCGPPWGPAQPCWG